MELTIEEKLDRLEAGLAEIGKRLDALEAERREELSRWEAQRERWAAADREVLAQYQEEEPVVNPVAAVNEEEERQFSEAMQRLDMCSDGGGVAAAVAEDAEVEAEAGVDRSFYFPRTDAERRGGRLIWSNQVALTDEKRWSWDR